MGTTIYAWLISLLLASGIVAGGYFYYKNTQATILSLTTEVATMQLAAQAYVSTITRLQEEKINNENALRDLGKKLRISEEYEDSLLNILHKHNLTNLAAKKPGMIEKRINEGTKNALDSLERTTTNDQ